MKQRRSACQPRSILRQLNEYDREGLAFRVRSMISAGVSITMVSSFSLAWTHHHQHREQPAPCPTAHMCKHTRQRAKQPVTTQKPQAMPQQMSMLVVQSPTGEKGSLLRCHGPPVVVCACCTASSPHKGATPRDISSQNTKLKMLKKQIVHFGAPFRRRQVSRGCSTAKHSRGMANPQCNDEKLVSQQYPLAEQHARLSPDGQHTASDETPPSLERVHMLS